MSVAPANDRASPTPAVPTTAAVTGDSNVGSATPSSPAVTNEGSAIPADAHLADMLARLCEIENKMAAAALGNRMALPNDWTYPTTPAVDVGSYATRKSFAFRDMAQVYALNKARCPEPVHAEKFAFLRMEAVKAGWVDVVNQSKIVLVDPLADDIAMRTLEADQPILDNERERAEPLAYCLPLILEHTFRTTGQHWFAYEASIYVDRYQRTIRACLLGDALGYLPPGLLYDEALHWIGPPRQMQVLKAQLNSAMLPDALKTRASHVPAGTALLSTCVEVIAALESANMADDFRRGGGYDFDLLKTVVATVKRDPFKYHMSRDLYGVDPPTADELSALEEARAVAVKFAPVAQAFIAVGLGDGKIHHAKALKRHADLNPVMRLRCEKFFQHARRRGEI